MATDTSTISSAEFIAILFVLKPGQVVDVRSAVECASLCLPGAVNIPLDQLHKEAITLTEDTIYLLSKSGVRARKAAE